MNNAVAIIPPSVKPKPTKSEMIEALTILQSHKFMQERQDAKAKADKLESAVAELIRRFISKHWAKFPVEIALGWPGTDKENKPIVSHASLNIPILFKELPASLQAKLVEASKAAQTVPSVPSKDYIRSQIAKSLATDITTRAAALIENPDMRSALETTLRVLNSGQSAIAKAEQNRKS